MFLGYLNVSSDIHYYTLQSGEDVCDFTDPSGLPLQGFKAKCELVKEASSPYNKSSVFLSVRVSDRPKHICNALSKSSVFWHHLQYRKVGHVFGLTCKL